MRYSAASHSPPAVQAGKLLSQVPLSSIPTLIGRGKTESVPVSPKVQLWVCDQSLSPEHASVCADPDSPAAAFVEDLHSGASVCVCTVLNVCVTTFGRRVVCAHII